MQSIINVVTFMYNIHNEYVMHKFQYYHAIAKQLVFYIE